MVLIRKKELTDGANLKKAAWRSNKYEIASRLNKVSMVEGGRLI